MLSGSSRLVTVVDLDGDGLVVVKISATSRVGLVQRGKTDTISRTSVLWAEVGAQAAETLFG